MKLNASENVLVSSIMAFAVSAEMLVGFASLNAFTAVISEMGAIDMYTRPVPVTRGRFIYVFFCSVVQIASNMSAQSRFQQVWLVPTSFGDAIRGKDEMVSEESGVMRRLGVPLSTASIIPVYVPLSDLRTVPFLPSDLPDPTRSATEVCNVCGFVAGFSTVAKHPAWRTVRSTLGSFKEAYTLRAGNLIFLRGKLVFKGAVAWQVVVVI
jgi:hypothetical protein